MEILSVGDHVNELYIVVGGMLETIKAGHAESADEMTLQMDSTSSLQGDTAGSTHGARCQQSLLPVLSQAGTASINIAQAHCNPQAAVDKRGSPSLLSLLESARLAMQCHCT